MTVKITVQDALKTYEFEIPVMEWLYLKRKLKALDEKSDNLRKRYEKLYKTIR